MATWLMEVGPKILNGNQVFSIQEVPYIVQLKYNGETICGGTILSSLLILTAAHCIYDDFTQDFIPFDQLSITAGELKKYENGLSSSTHGITKFISPEIYDPSKHLNDLVILVLSYPLSFNENIQPVPVSSAPIKLGEKRIYGWGATENNTSPAILRRATVKILSSGLCTELYGNSYVPSQMLCAGGYDGKLTTGCEGDSGGPLLCLKPTRLCGITSFGDRANCSDTKRPVVYSNVIYYYDWIKSIMDKYKTHKCFSNQFQCKDGNCISLISRCDLIVDCEDLSDEINCPKRSIISFPPQRVTTSSPSRAPTFAPTIRTTTISPPTTTLRSQVTPRTTRRPSQTPQTRQFQCLEKRISTSQVCDGVADCYNGIDELGCFGCAKDETFCPNSNKCYKKDEFCFYTRNVSDYKAGHNFKYCRAVTSLWKDPQYSLALQRTVKECVFDRNCDGVNGVRCIKCWKQISCKGAYYCRNSLETCDTKERVAAGNFW